MNPTDVLGSTGLKQYLREVRAVARCSGTFSLQLIHGIRSKRFSRVWLGPDSRRP